MYITVLKPQNVDSAIPIKPNNFAATKFRIITDLKSMSMVFGSSLFSWIFQMEDFFFLPPKTSIAQMASAVSSTDLSSPSIT